MGPEMETIYIRATPSSAAHEPYGPDKPDDTRRTWFVTVTTSKSDDLLPLADPFRESQYTSVFERYLHHSDRHRWSPQSLTYDEHDDDAVDDLAAAEAEIARYGDKLLAQLRLDLAPDTTGCRLVVVEDDKKARAPTAGIHCLAWELVEAARLPKRPLLRFHVTRVGNFPGLPRSVTRGSLHPHLAAPARPTLPLSAVQADPGAMFKVLLVVARDFTRTGAQRDPEPDLAQWPLMNLQKKLRSRLLLEVVRPGSKEELEEHLRVREAQGVRFNLVHLDLHGRIKDVENRGQVPCLLFARGRHHSREEYQVPQTQLADAEDVARLLARYHVENVVLNACLSAYNRSGSQTNLAHILLRHGIDNVSAMWFYVHSKTVATYLGTFYEELLDKGTDFHVAAHRGRDAIRAKPTERTGRVYQDFFLCVNYRRGRGIGTIREPSPTPSTSSSTSTSSVRSFVSGVWRPSTPRLGDALILADEPIMRMQLHFLELEYKLMCSRVVYASDLGGKEPDLDAKLESMISMWLATNLVDEVQYHKAKDFARRHVLGEGAPSPREKKARGAPNATALLQRFLPRPVKALRQTLHVVREVDGVVDPGWQSGEEENRRAELRRFAVQEALQRFVDRLHGEGGSYLLFVGHKDAQWFRTHLEHLNGTWWLHVNWGYTLHTRHRRP